ncbi:hypothetical protein [Pseudomonas putida]|uniref:Uncharacterized protein n=1 Tax=Pseudomonas putida TaxID=303 RepID=A0A8I1ECY6_PSEPU|nr:hypothetical protein [Pseudomonas putida]MBI6883241.1 hypothetical protein [Pseudomonas putida]
MAITLTKLQTQIFTENLVSDHKAIASLVGIVSAKISSKYSEVKDRDIELYREDDDGWVDMLMRMGTLIESFERPSSQDGYSKGMDLLRDYSAQVTLQAMFAEFFKYIQQEREVILTEEPGATARLKLERFSKMSGIKFSYGEH